MTDNAEAQPYTPDEWRMALALWRFERKHVGDDLLSEDEFRKLLPEQHLFHRDRARVALGVRAPAGDAVREALERLNWVAYEAGGRLKSEIVSYGPQFPSELFIADLRTILAALDSPSPAVPVGFVNVPIELTEAMLDAAMRLSERPHNLNDLWATMLDADPSSSGGEHG